MAPIRRKPRIIRETVKDRHTSHWDLDMLSRAELEELLVANTAQANGAELPDDTPEEPGSDPATASPTDPVKKTS